MNYLIVDYGTSSCRASIVNDSGIITSFCRKSTIVETGRGVAEIDTEKAWAVVVSVISELLAEAEYPEISVIGVSALLGWVFLDSRDNPLDKSIIWMDAREDEQLKNIISQNKAEMYKKTGRRLSPELLISKWTWLSRHKPEITSQTVRIISLKDEIIRRLTGKTGIDYAHINYTMLWNINEHKLDSDLLEIAKMNSSLFPESDYPYEKAGEITSTAAAATGLKSGISVIRGSIDGTTAMYGGGIALPETGVLVSGTTDVFMTLVNADKMTMQKNETLTVNTGMISGTLAVGGSTGLSGGSLTKFTDLLDGDYHDLLNKLEKTVPGAEGLLCIPGLSGERAPYWNKDISGSLIGLRMDHDGEHIIRAIMEGSAYRLKRLMLELFKIIPPLEKLNIVGGCSNINIWNSIKADVIGLPLVKPTELEATTIGTAIFCECFLNSKADLSTISAKWIAAESEFTVNNDNHQFYNEMFNVYENYIHNNLETYLALSRLKRSLT